MTDATIEPKVFVQLRTPLGDSVYDDVADALKFVTIPAVSGGTSIYYDNDLDETAISVKSSAGQIFWFNVINLASSVRYFQIFNVAVGSVTVGTTTPTMQFPIPTQGDSNGAGFTLSIPAGIEFNTEITVAATTNSEGNGAPSANDVHVNMGFA